MPPSDPTDSSPLRLQLARTVRILQSGTREIARQAADEVGLDASLLDPFLGAAMAATAAGRRLESAELAACRRVGVTAAEQGVSGADIVDLHLSATWRLWEGLARSSDGDPAVLTQLGTLLIRAADDATSALAAGFDDAQRRTIRRDEALRGEFVDDLLAGRVTHPEIEDHAARFGFVASAPHVVVVAEPADGAVELSPRLAGIEVEVARRVAGRDLLVALREAQVVAVLPGATADPAGVVRAAVEERAGGRWHLGIGRPHRGTGGVARSFEQARVALDLASRSGTELPDAHHDRLVALRLLTHDPGLVDELVSSVLDGLHRARGGAAPLVATLQAYFDTGLNTTATARALHLSARGVLHRFATIERLTGYDPRDAADRFTLELAIRARRLHGQPGA